MKTDTAFDYQWQMAEQNFKGETREYLKFRLLKENYGAIGNYAFYHEKFKKTCKDKDFVTYLDGLPTKNTHIFNIEELASPLSDTAGQVLTWSDILAKNKGKKIYLIASEFPVFQINGQQLAHKMADFEQNNTQIIFLSTDKNKDKWQQNVKLGEAKRFEHYHLSSKDTTLLNFLNTKDEGFKLFSSILIDENGKVVLTRAADPNKFDLLLRQLKVATKVIVP